MWLDKKKDYGTIHGEGMGGVSFEQDGFLFDGNGRIIPDHPLYSKEKAAKAAELHKETEGHDKPAEPITAANVDLKAWALGNRTGVGFIAVREAIRKKYNKSVTNGEQAMHALIEAGVVTAKELKAQ